MAANEHTGNGPPSGNNMANVRDELLARGKRRQTMAARYLLLILVVLIVAIAGLTLVPFVINWERGLLRSPTTTNIIDTNLGRIARINADVSKIDDELAEIRARSRSFRDVRLVSNGYGMVVGSQGTVLTTSDGTITWTVRTTGLDESLYSVALHSDGKTGLAVGRRGTVLTTDDGGNTWTKRPSGTDGSLYSVALHSDGKTGLAVGQRGTVLTTDDGGKTWTNRPSGTDGSLYSVALHSDGKTGLAVGQRGTVLSTEDGGNTWTNRPSGTDRQLYSVALHSDGKTGLAVGQRGTVLTTDDGGKTWTNRPSGTDGSLYSVALHSDGKTGLAVGQRGTVLTTDDGGKTWTNRPSGTDRQLYSVILHGDGNTGTAVGLARTILKTENKGATWTGHRRGRGVDPDQLQSERQKLLDERERLASENRKLELGLVPAVVSRTRKQPPDTDPAKQTDLFARVNWDDLITKTTWRVSIVVLSLFLMQVLVSLNRYNQRLAAYYFARADVFSLLGAEASPDPKSISLDVLERLTSLLSPDGLDFGRTPKTVLDKALEIVGNIYKKSRSSEV